MTEIMEAAKDAYLADFVQFERDISTRDEMWVRRLRASALSQFAGLSFPTNKDEEWRYTNIAPIIKTPFRISEDYLCSIKPNDISFSGNRLVFVNGHYSPSESYQQHLDGIQIGNLATFLNTTRGGVEPYLAKYADYRSHIFTALNTAFMNDGAFIYIPKGKVVEQPIHLLFLSTNNNGDASISHPRVLIVAEGNTRVAVIEDYVGVDNGTYFTNAVTEIVAGEDSAVEHYKLQRESNNAFHISTIQVKQNHSSRFTSHSISLGGMLTRNDINVALNGEGSECTLNGLYIVDNKQHMDNHTTIDHSKPHTYSRELYKGVLDGTSRGVFNGRVIVHQNAQKVDALQINKNLLLSADAIINTKPQLEIFANDVKCKHGATVGQLNPDAMFYLRSRGIGIDAARNILTSAFTNDIVSNIKNEKIRNWLYKLVSAHLQNGLRLEAIV